MISKNAQKETGKFVIFVNNETRQKRGRMLL